ncbi:MAG: uracil-DNA glycosylase family protein [bacterium]
MSNLIRDFHGKVTQCATCFGLDAITVPKFSDIGPNPPRILLLGEQPDRDVAGATGENSLENVADPGIERLRMFIQRAPLDLSDVYYATSVLCLPRDGSARPARPAIREVKGCTIHIQHLIGLLAPRLIIPLGHTAIQSIQWIYRDWRELGRFILNYDIGNVLERKGISVYPLYHPSAFTLKSRPESRQIRDWQRVPGILRSTSVRA